MKRRIFLRVFAGYAVMNILAVLVFAIYALGLGCRISHDALTRGLESAARTALGAGPQGDGRDGLAIVCRVAPRSRPGNRLLFQ
jgi:hypothetical protein